jgi:hypothetical protein
LGLNKKVLLHRRGRVIRKYNREKFSASIKTFSVTRQLEMRLFLGFSVRFVKHLCMKYPTGFVPPRKSNPSTMSFAKCCTYPTPMRISEIVNHLSTSHKV